MFVVILLSKYEKKKNCGNYDNAITENGRKKKFVCGNVIAEIWGKNNKK